MAEDIRELHVPQHLSLVPNPTNEDDKGKMWVEGQHYSHRGHEYSPGDSGCEVKRLEFTPVSVLFGEVGS